MNTIRFVKKRTKEPNIDYSFFFDKESLEDLEVFTYNDILETVKALKEVKKTGLARMDSLVNVINVLNGLGYEKESNIITFIKDGKRFSIKFYHMMITMIED